MSRVALTDDSGTWFETNSAVLFKEDTRWDGRNQISVPTGSQWEHEWLYYTKSGKWVMHTWSNYQGRGESYEQVSEEKAVEWLIQNACFDRDEIQELPEGVRLAVQNGFAQAEI